LHRLTLNAGFDLYRLVVAVLEVKEWEGEVSARSHNQVDSGDSICVRVTVWGVMDLPPSLIFFSIITNSTTVLLAMPREEHSR
jgi:hypothetical protein